MMCGVEVVPLIACRSTRAQGRLIHSVHTVSVLLFTHNNAGIAEET